VFWKRVKAQGRLVEKDLNIRKASEYSGRRAKMEIRTKGKLNALMISMDVIGFSLLFIGAGLIRFAKDEPVAIAGGVVLAVGASVLGITRWMGK
jgi:F0F1-type ATP synthase assembly protein I